MPRYCLAVNCGSSSIKFKVFQLLDGSASHHPVVVAGSASNVQGDKPAQYKFKWTRVPVQGSDNPKLDHEQPKELESSTAYQDVFERILADVTAENVLGDDGKDAIAIVAHRIVHGGTAEKPIVIRHGDKNEQSVLDDMDKVSDFAPLHVRGLSKRFIKNDPEFLHLCVLQNHHAMLIVKKCLESLPKASSVLCFDTLFHRTIPEFRKTYAISQPSHKTPVPLKRFGFHGLSYGSIVKTMSQELNVEGSELNLVVAHLGSGASTCLIQRGKSTNTSMGVTPLEGGSSSLFSFPDFELMIILLLAIISGLPGGTRSGTLDASLIFHHTPDCSDTVEWSGRKISKAEYVLNKESGFKGKCKQLKLWLFK